MNGYRESLISPEDMLTEEIPVKKIWKWQEKAKNGGITSKMRVTEHDVPLDNSFSGFAEWKNEQ